VNLEMSTAMFMGLLAGWLAGRVMRAGPFGVVGDLVLGVLGGVVASGIFWALGVFPRLGLVPIGVVAFAGAAGVLAALRALWHEPPARPRRRRSVASGAWRAEQK
jgi:uncharacterized membrane protein YeaQ/YmgE (transglycosylase-associated protein family)